MASIPCCPLASVSMWVRAGCNLRPWIKLPPGWVLLISVNLSEATLDNPGGGVGVDATGSLERRSIPGPWDKSSGRTQEGSSLLLTPPYSAPLLSLAPLLWCFPDLWSVSLLPSERDGEINRKQHDSPPCNLELLTETAQNWLFWNIVGSKSLHLTVNFYF